jgi:hypothetical protein
VSWRILLEDLARAYSQAEAGKVPELGSPGARYQDWALHLHKAIRSGHWHAELDHWAALAEGLDLNDPEPLIRYQRRRRPENLAMLAAMRTFKTLFAETRLPVALLRAVGMSAFDRADPLKRWVMRAAGGA